MTGQAPSIRAKDDLTIDLVGERCIVVADGRGKGGGNVRSRPRTSIRWTNRTGYPCRLYFFELAPDDVDGDGPATWPFDEPAGLPPSGQQIPATGPGGSPARWSGTLKAGLEAVVKYDVVVETGTANPPRLDPIIIVRE
jgi:hypothetical protein